MNDTDADREKRQAIERANAYREMMNSWAWKDLRERIERIKWNSVTMIDEPNARDVNLVQVGESRGVRMGFAQMESEINFILGEGQ